MSNASQQIVNKAWNFGHVLRDDGLPYTGIYYAQGVKANVLFFDAKPAQEAAWTSKLWVYNLRTNMLGTLLRVIDREPPRR